MSPTVDAKSALRRIAKAKRASVPTAVQTHAAAAIAALGLAWLKPPAGPGTTVSAFLSFGDELDTAPILRNLYSQGIKLCLPVMQGRDQPLGFRAWSPGDALVTVQWGIQEPQPTKPAVTPDILLVPLLAFDRRGNRLGYGGGYYDRTLAARRAGDNSCLAIGLAYDEQEVDAVPHLDYDQRLDGVLTPTGGRLFQ